MRYGEGDSPQEVHGTQLRVATDTLTYRTNRLLASSEWTVHYAEQLLGGLLLRNGFEPGDFDEEADYSGTPEADSSTL
jgi:hypothetical protein